MRTSILASHWTLIAAGAVAAAVYVYFVFLPAEGSLGGLRAELASAEQFIQEVEAYGPAVKATRHESEKTQKYVQQWEESAPSEAELSALFGRIHQLAKESGSTTTRFEPQAAVQYEKIRRFPVLMACTGSFGQVCQFLQALEGQKETIWIESLKIERSGEDSKDVQCELTMAIFADNPNNSDQVNRSE